jgi:hypothetical protein
MIPTSADDCVLASTNAAILRKHDQVNDKYRDEALDRILDKTAGQRFHNHSPLDFEKLKGDPDNIEKHLVSYIKGFSANARKICEFFEFGSGSSKIDSSTIPAYALLTSGDCCPSGELHSIACKGLAIEAFRSLCCRGGLPR